MANNVYPLASDNWSNVANWYSNGVAYGMLPQVDDAVYMNNCSLNVDMNINVASISALACSPAIQTIYNNVISLTHSGSVVHYVTATFTNINIQSSSPSNIYLVVNGDLNYSSYDRNYTINSNITLNGSITGTYRYHSGGDVYYGIINSIINGNVSASMDVGAYNCVINNGTVTGGTTPISYGAYNCVLNNCQMHAGACAGAYWDSASTNLTVTGDLVSPSILNAGNQCVVINGNVSVSGSTMSLTGAGRFYINGSITGGATAVSSTVGGVDVTGAGAELHVNGSITGGTATNCIAVSLRTAANKVFVNGTCTGGSNINNTPAILAQFASQTIDVTHVTAGAYPAISLTALCTCIIRGNETYVAGICPASGLATQVWQVDNTANQTVVQQAVNGSNRTFATSGAASWFPAPNNVKIGIVYGNDGEITGTCSVPPVEQVGVGVLVGQTVGTAIFTATNAEDIATAVWNTLDRATNAGAVKLRKGVTEELLGTMLAAFHSQT